MRTRLVVATFAGALLLLGIPQGAFAHGGGGGGGGGGHSGSGQSASGRSGADRDDRARSGGDRDDRARSTAGRSGGDHRDHDGDRVRHDRSRCCDDGYFYGYPYYYGYPYGYGYGYGYGGGYNDACAYSGDSRDCSNGYGPSPHDQGSWDCRSDPYRDRNRYRQACRYYEDCTNYPRCKD